MGAARQAPSWIAIGIDFGALGAGPAQFFDEQALEAEGLKAVVQAFDLQFVHELNQPC